MVPARDCSLKRLRGKSSDNSTRDFPNRCPDPKGGLLVAGSLAVDTICNYRPTVADSVRPEAGTSNPASVVEGAIGGVGQNVATAAHFCGAKVLLCSWVGCDDGGRLALSELQRRGMDVRGVMTAAGSCTGRYIAFNDSKGKLEMAMANMEAFEDEHSSFAKQWESLLDQLRPSWLAVDANWHPYTLRKWIESASKFARVAFEPVSVEKSVRVFSPRPGRRTQVEDDSPSKLVDLATPNLLELRAMAHCAPQSSAWHEFLCSLRPKAILDDLQKSVDRPVQNLSPDIPLAAFSLLPSIPCIIAKAGADGVILTEVIRSGDSRLLDPWEEGHIMFRLYDKGKKEALPMSAKPTFEQIHWCKDFEGVYMRNFRPPVSLHPREIVNTNGTGDSLLGILLAGLVREPSRTISDLIQVAQEGAALTLQSVESVSPRIRDQAFRSKLA